MAHSRCDVSSASGWLLRLVGVAASLPLAAVAMAQGAPAAPPSSSDQAQLEAAKRHPIATPEPRPVYPEQSPPPRADARPLYPSERPPPRPERPLPAQAPAAPRATAAPPSYVGDRRAEAEDDSAQDEVSILAPESPPPVRVERVLTAPAPGYIWAPGYWYWYRGGYVWISGEWLPPRVGYVYVGPRWAHTYNGWAFSSGGWSARGDIVTYPVYRHRYVWDRSYRPNYYYRGDVHRPAYRYDAPRAPARPYRRDAPPAYSSPRGSRPVHIHPRR